MTDVNTSGPVLSFSLTISTTKIIRKKIKKKNEKKEGVSAQVIQM